MTVHLSTRVTWHDRGWDGRVCDCAVENSSCLMHKHIRESRDDEREMRFAGELLGGLDDWLPPCSRDANAFSPAPFRIIHRDPLEWRDLPAVEEEVPPFSLCPAPYRWMREEHLRDIVEMHQIDLPPPSERDREFGWVNEPDRQRILLRCFWEKLEENRSLIFFYCNRGNPIEDGPSRLLVGASRLCDLGPQLMFGKTPKYGADHPVWSRRVTHEFPSQGVRLPLQEYLREGRPLGRLVCPAPEDGGLAFSYVSEHVPDDLAVGALERLVQATEAAKADAIVDADWEHRLAWLDDALAETWSGRGPLPGIGAVLRSLGMERGIAFQRAELSDPSLSRQELWEKADALLDGRRQPEDEGAFYDGIKRARQRWRGLPTERRQLLATLARFELSVDQIVRVDEPRKRSRCGIEATESEIVANPYLLFEQDEGTAESPRIGLDTVDRGVVLDLGTWAGEERTPPDDLTRVRASMIALLEAAAERGDTLSPLDPLLDGVEERFPERRRCDADRDLVLGNRDFFDQALQFETLGDQIFVALPRLREAERKIAEVVRRRSEGEVAFATPEPDWKASLAGALAGDASSISDAAEERARAEKLAALRLLYRRRLSVLTGRAGTGKTSVLRAFLDGLGEAEGHQDVLLLAPTGKARVRLARATRRETKTIHQFLLRNKWLREDTLAIRREEGDRRGAPTVIVDEASMIPVDLLGTLLRALDLNEVKRLILVGDPNQLPPIGPGRPFVDLLSWLEAEDDRRHCIAELEERVRHEDIESRALLLADGYLRGTPPAGDDELLASVARGESDGDLAARFYANPAELGGALWETIGEAIGEKGENVPAHAAFTQSLDAEGPTGEGAERWQILSPVRAGSGGTEDINRRVQQRYKAGLLNRSRRRGVTFGDEEIVWTDKVMQIVNRGRRASPPKTGLDYVANGEIGVVVKTDRDGKHLTLAFSTQRDVTYRYYGSDAGEELQLAYAITVHKAQGSDFDTVILIVPAQAPTVSRELLYTALTRFRKRVILLIEKDISVLAQFRRPEHSEVTLRNTNLFEPQLRPAERGATAFRHLLIHQAGDGTMVRSKSELIVLEALLKTGASVRYEQPLASPSAPSDFRLPDFTVLFEGETYYWEHLGMLDVTSYARSWARKRAWYERNGFLDRVITSADGPGIGLRVPEIAARAERRILRREPRGEDEPGFDAP